MPERGAVGLIAQVEVDRGARRTSRGRPTSRVLRNDRLVDGSGRRNSDSSARRGEAVRIVDLDESELGVRRHADADADEPFRQQHAVARRVAPTVETSRSARSIHRWCGRSDRCRRWPEPCLNGGGHDRPAVRLLVAGAARAAVRAERLEEQVADIDRAPGVERRSAAGWNRSNTNRSGAFPFAARRSPPPVSPGAWQRRCTSPSRKAARPMTISLLRPGGCGPGSPCRQRRSFVEP